MSCSKSMKRKQDEIAKRILISWLIIFTIGLTVGGVSGTLIARANDTKTEAVKNFTEEVQEAEASDADLIVETEESEKTEQTLLGTYRITAYCSCEKCCGEWAKNRIDGIVKGAAGVELTPGISVACSLPFGTKLYIEGYGEVVVQDRIAEWVNEKYDDKVIDVYFNNHSEALEFGVKNLSVYQIESEE